MHTYYQVFLIFNQTITTELLAAIKDATGHSPASADLPKWTVLFLFKTYNGANLFLQKFMDRWPEKKSFRLPEINFNMEPWNFIQKEEPYAFPIGQEVTYHQQKGTVPATVIGHEKGSQYRIEFIEDGHAFRRHQVESDALTKMFAYYMVKAYYAVKQNDPKIFDRMVQMENGEVIYLFKELEPAVHMLGFLSEKSPQTTLCPQKQYFSEEPYAYPKGTKVLTSTLDMGEVGVYTSTYSCTVFVTNRVSGHAAFRAVQQNTLRPI